MAITKRIKNDSGADVFILTRVVADQAYYDVPYKLWVEILDDEDLLASVALGDLVVNDGTSDLDTVDGVAWLKRFQANEPAEIDLDSNIGKTFQVEFTRSGSVKNKWLCVSNSKSPSNETPFFVPYDVKLIRTTMSNSKSGADSNIEIHVSPYGDGNLTTLAYTWSIVNKRVDCKDPSDPTALLFDAGDKIGVFARDTGTDLKDAIITLYFVVLTDDLCVGENYSGDINSAGTGSS